MRALTSSSRALASSVRVWISAPASSTLTVSAKTAAAADGDGDGILAALPGAPGGRALGISFLRHEPTGKFQHVATSAVCNR